MTQELIEVIYDVETETITTRPYTQAEISEAQENKALANLQTQELTQAQTARDAAKEKLAVLGLTQDDLAALGF